MWRASDAFSTEDFEKDGITALNKLRTTLKNIMVRYENAPPLLNELIRKVEGLITNRGQVENAFINPFLLRTLLVLMHHDRKTQIREDIKTQIRVRPLYDGGVKLEIEKMLTALATVAPPNGSFNTTSEIETENVPEKGYVIKLLVYNGYDKLMEWPIPWNIDSNFRRYKEMVTKDPVNGDGKFAREVYDDKDGDPKLFDEAYAHVKKAETLHDAMQAWEKLMLA
jgi:hypothetical protein